MKNQDELIAELARIDEMYEWESARMAELPRADEEPEVDQLEYWRRAGLDHRGQP